MAKQKRIFDKEKHNLQKALRIPTARKSYTLKDKTRYSRKTKHKEDNHGEDLTRNSAGNK